MEHLRTEDGSCGLFFRHQGLVPQLGCYDTCRSSWDHFVSSPGQCVDTTAGNPLNSETDTTGPVAQQALAGRNRQRGRSQRLAFRDNGASARMRR